MPNSTRTFSCFRLNVSFALCLLLMGLGSSLSEAQERQTLHAESLRAPVEIVTDRWGISHIYAENEHDLFFAQGYDAARNRLFQFEVWRRQATGTVAEILGERELTRDIGARLHQFRGDMTTRAQYGTCCCATRGRGGQRA